MDRGHYNTFIPIEGSFRKSRKKLDTNFAKKIADHRNAILKDWAIKYEIMIKPEVPKEYISPFEEGKCIFCLCEVGKNNIDEFRPVKDKGRMNRVNCNPCCGICNSSKSDKCGNKLVQWINNGGKKGRISDDQREKLMKWYISNEKYLIIPDSTKNTDNGMTYGEECASLDSRLNEVYEEFQ